MVSSKKKVLSAFLSLAMIGSMVAAVPLTASADTTTATPVVTYSVHQQSYGWESTVTGPATAGVTGQSKRLEALKINAPSGATISYSVHQQSYGWEAAVSNGATAGITGKSKRLEAVKISLSGLPGYTIQYRVHQQSYGWENWVSNGAVAGVTGQSKRLEAIEIKLVPTVATMSAVSSTIGVGGSTTFTFKNADGTAYTPKTVTYSLADASFGSIDTTGKFTASKAGAAVVNAVADGVSLSTTVNVYGIAAAVKLSAASSTVLANGAATDVITATAVDANGNTVANYAGQVTVTMGSGATTYGKFGAADTTNITLTNGVGTATLTSAGSATGTDTVVSSVLTATAPSSQAVSISYGTLALTFASPAATAIALSPASAVVSSNGNTENDVTVTIQDASGNKITTPEYVTFTISGPGTFSSGNSTAVSETFYVTGTYTLPVFAIQGVNGTVSVTATASGLTSGTTTFKTVQTTAAAKVTLASTTGTLTSAGSTATGLPVGTTFTTYTATIVDANGYPVPATTTLTISDNTSALADGGTIKYYSVDANGQPTGSAWAAFAKNLSNVSQISFIVVNSTTGSTNPTIKVADSLTSTSATATYSYVTSAASQVAFTSAATEYVKAGQTVTYKVQLEDASGNALKIANQVVKFYFDSATTFATINGSSNYVKNGNVYTTLTDSNGIATVTVVYTSSATGAITLDAQLAAETAAQVVNNVVTGKDYATAIGIASATASAGNTITAATWPATSIQPSASGVLPTATVYALNALGQVVTQADSIKISTSNSAVVAINGGTSNTIASGVALGTNIMAKSAGTATITFQDISNPDLPVLTETLTVVAGSPANVKALNPDGTFKTSYTFASAGVSGAFTLELVDAGGNVVPTTSPITLTKAEVLTATGATGIASGVRLASGSTDVTTVTIPANQSTVVVYLDGLTASTATTAADVLPLSSVKPNLTAATVAGKTLTLTFDNPILTTADAATLAAKFTVAGIASTPTVTSAVVNNNVVTLTLSAASVKGDATPTVTYDATGTLLTTGYSASVASITTAAVANQN